jgi:hypothetical protein
MDHVTNGSKYACILPTPTGLISFSIYWIGLIRCSTNSHLSGFLDHNSQERDPSESFRLTQIYMPERRLRDIPMRIVLKLFKVPQEVTLMPTLRIAADKSVTQKPAL